MAGEVPQALLGSPLSPDPAPRTARVSGAGPRGCLCTPVRRSAPALWKVGGAAAGSGHTEEWTDTCSLVQRVPVPGSRQPPPTLRISPPRVLVSKIDIM